MKLKTIFSRFGWYWKCFWGTRYRIIKDKKEIQDILIYHHKIYILEIKKRKEGKIGKI